MSKDLVFVAAKRTPFGTFGGSLKALTATQLATHASTAALKASGISPQAIDHVVFGNVIQSSSDAAYLARHVGLRSGVAQETPAVTVNRLCGSGFEAIAVGARLINNDEAETVLVGGTENMTQSPYVLRNARFGYRMNHGELEDSLVAGLYDGYAEIAMSGTAELLAEDYKISRKECDEYSLRSQQSATQAIESGVFQDEIAPIELKERKGVRQFSEDEHVRKDASLEALSKLKPVFKKDGVITAGNASGICDGAAALVLSTQKTAETKGWSILGHLRANFNVGVDPSRMGIGPVYAIRGLLKKTGLSLDKISRFEINEAFASQYLAVEKELELDRNKVNVNGGAIAIGHPLGATGARLVTHLLHQLPKLDGKLAIASACIGGGQGQALLIER